MGNVLAGMMEEQADFELLAMIDPLKGESLSDVSEEADVVIDFSNPENQKMLTEYCSAHKCPAVIATTGLTDEQQAEIQKLSEEVPVVFSANFSLGITVMKEGTFRDNAYSGKEFRYGNGVEKHHNKKLDAPSGTAKMLVAAMNPDGAYEEIYGRSGNRRRGREIGVHAVRGGTIAGEHTAIYAGEDEILEIRHNAGSKKIFASGALTAARFLQDAKAGLYNMEDVLFG